MASRLVPGLGRRRSTLAAIFHMPCRRSWPIVSSRGFDLTSLRRGCRVLILALLMVLPTGLAAADKAGVPASTAVLTVALDDNYPPYVFRDANGTLTGYLVDTWKLWETKTGVRVDLLGSDWTAPQQRMNAGQAAVIDTIFRTPERERSLDFSPPYEALAVSIYNHVGIGGVVDLTTLRGFLIGVKAGDGCVETLAAAGIDSLRFFASYEALVRAAIDGKVRDNPLAAIETMDKLRAHGVRMSIDDFGTDYSSMSYLKRFRVHKLKIDRSFVADLSTDPDGAAIVAAIIGLAHNLGLRTVAEGVESEEQLAFLRGMAR